MSNSPQKSWNRKIAGHFWEGISTHRLSSQLTNIHQSWKGHAPYSILAALVAAAQLASRWQLVVRPGRYTSQGGKCRNDTVLGSILENLNRKKTWKNKKPNKLTPHHVFGTCEQVSWNMLGLFEPLQQLSRQEMHSAQTGSKNWSRISSWSSLWTGPLRQQHSCSV